MKNVMQTVVSVEQLALRTRRDMRIYGMDWELKLACGHSVFRPAKSWAVSSRASVAPPEFPLSARVSLQHPPKRVRCEGCVYNQKQAAERARAAEVDADQRRVLGGGA